MLFLLIFFIFVFGLCIGSFLNVLIYRLPHSLLITGRSLCPKCKKKIAWYDNIPLVSFILLGGRCRHCHSPISWQYPVVEVATGLLTVFSIQYSVFSNQNLLSIIYYLLSIYALIVIFVTDLKYEIIPDQVVYPAIFLALIYDFLVPVHLGGVLRTPSEVSLGYLFPAIIAGLLFLFLHLITKGKGMGLGDVKLALLMGLFLGFPKILVALYLAFLTGAVVGVILIITGKKKLGSHIPFGPFLAGSTILALFYGEVIWEKLIGGLP